MNQEEARKFIQHYFAELFGKHNIEALDEFLHLDYFDDDIGDPHVNHLQNSKEYLRALFAAEPSIKVEVLDVIIRDEVITAYLKWYSTESGIQKTLRKGVALFVIRDDQIIKRHTFLYYEA